MPTGLIRRGARYSIRRRVPLDLVQHYGGKAEVTQALGTADPKIARKLLPLKWAALEREFDALRVSIASNPALATLPLPPKAKAAPKVKDRWETMSREEFDYQQEADAFFLEQVLTEEGERDEREELERKILRFVDGPAEGLTQEQLATFAAKLPVRVERDCVPQFLARERRLHEAVIYRQGEARELGRSGSDGFSKSLSHIC